jgi:chemotaxis protein MotB
MEGQKIIIKKVKKVVNEGGGHGGSWKVAYADFVTAMMAFFLLLWLLTMTSGEKRARISNYFRYFSIFSSGGSAVLNPSVRKASDAAVIQQLGEDGARPRHTPQRAAATPPPQADKNAPGRGLSREQVKQKIVHDVSLKLTDVKDQVIVESIEGGLKIQLVDKESNQMFPVGSAELTPQAREILKVICETIRDRNAKFAIVGHTDARPYPSDYYTNWELSAERACTARLELQQNGITADRILQVTGFADTQPLIKDDPYDLRNRRISIMLIDTDPAESPPPSLQKQASEQVAEPALAPVPEPVPEPALAPAPEEVLAQVPEGLPEPVLEKVVDFPKPVINTRMQGMRNHEQ